MGGGGGDGRSFEQRCPRVMGLDDSSPNVLEYCVLVRPYDAHEQSHESSKRERARARVQSCSDALYVVYHYWYQQCVVCRYAYHLVFEVWHTNGTMCTKWYTCTNKMYHGTMVLYHGSMAIPLVQCTMVPHGTRVRTGEYYTLWAIPW